MDSFPDAVAAIPSAIWAIVGGLVGALVANSNARRMAKDRMRHENRTRFHEKRLEIYLSFVETAYRLRSLVPRISLGDQDEARKERRAKEEVASERLNNLRDSIFLLGSPEVNLVADQVVSIYWELWTTHETNDVEAQRRKYEEFHSQLLELKSHMRNELEPDD